MQKECLIFSSFLTLRGADSVFLNLNSLASAEGWVEDQLEHHLAVSSMY